jgi:FixJ family two-component response regulator
LTTHLATLPIGSATDVPFPSRVVVIEDDADERSALGRVLRIGGFEVTSYASAEEFLAAPPTGPLCLLLDLQLDGMSGLELLRRLRAEGSVLPVVVNTAGDDTECSREAEELGCVAFLRKPFSGRDLLTLLRALAAEGGARPA